MTRQLLGFLRNAKDTKNTRNTKSRLLRPLAMEPLEQRSMMSVTPMTAPPLASLNTPSLIGEALPCPRLMVSPLTVEQSVIPLAEREELHANPMEIQSAGLQVAASPPDWDPWNKTLTLNGEDSDDDIVVTGSSQGLTVTRTDKNGHTTQVFCKPQHQFERILVYLKGGNDKFRNDSSVKAQVYGGAGKDHLIGSDTAHDYLVGGHDPNIWNSTLEDDGDVLEGRGGNDILVGGLGDDLIRGGSGDDQLEGNDGSDRLWGGDDNDVIFGGRGNDLLFGENGNDTLYGDLATVRYPVPDKGIDVLDGGLGKDTLVGGKHESYGPRSSIGFPSMTYVVDEGSVVKVEIQCSPQDADVASSVEWTLEGATSDMFAPNSLPGTIGRGPRQPNVVTFQPGQRSATLEFRLADDQIDKGARSFHIRLSNPTNAQIQLDRTTVTIRDNDAKQTPGGGGGGGGGREGGGGGEGGGGEGGGRSETPSSETPQNSIGVLVAGGELQPGGEVKSADGRFRLTLQTDGNLVLYGPQGALWSTGTHGCRVTRAIMQDDGNFVLYNGNFDVWYSGTHGNPGSRLTVRDDGNVVISAPNGKPLWSTGTQWAGNRDNRPFNLVAGEKLLPGQEIRSADGRFRLTLQTDGNLVLYGPKGKALWSTRTNGKPVTMAVMQDDGNFVLYNGGTAVWHTRTHGNPGARLVVDDAGNVVIRGLNGKELWRAR